MDQMEFADEGPWAGTTNLPSLKEAAAAHLREKILTGKLVSGSKIDTERVSEALGMSRVPVREALIELTQEHLVETIPRRGAFVARLERADIIDHYRIFGLIAGLAASRAASALTADELANLRSIHESFLSATTPDEMAYWNYHFHRVIHHAGGSKRLLSVLKLMSRSMPPRYFEFVENWPEIAGRQHARILGALAARDAHEAQRSVEYHHYESGELAVEVLEKMGFWAAQGGDADQAEPDAS
jgi:DNA-binding GntR family transcriptional regulator